VGDRVMLVGDAANQADPLNGGGIHKAMEGAALAAAPPTVSARISTGYAKRTLALCGDRDPSPYTYFHRGAQILIQGTVRPRPPARPWYVAIRRKHCVGKKFEGNLGDITIRGRPDGTFRTVYTARLRACPKSGLLPSG